MLKRTYPLFVFMLKKKSTFFFFLNNLSVDTIFLRFNNHMILFSTTYSVNIMYTNTHTVRHLTFFTTVTCSFSKSLNKKQQNKNKKTIRQHSCYLFFFCSFMFKFNVVLNYICRKHRWDGWRKISHRSHCFLLPYFHISFYILHWRKFS